MLKFVFELHFQEVQRIKNEDPDDACALMNDRVTGSLKVTWAFVAGVSQTGVFTIFSFRY